MNKKQAAKILWPYVKPHLWPVVISMLLSIPMAALTAAPTKLFQFLTDDVLVKKDYDSLRIVALVIPLAFLVNFVVRFFNNYLIRAAANRMTQQIRNDIFQHLLRLSIGYFNEARGGVVLSKVMIDLQTISRAISNLIDVVKEPLSLIFLLGYAFYLNWGLTLVTLIVLPLTGILLSNAGKHSKRYSHRIFEKLGEMSSQLSESISGMRVIQAFSLQGYLRGQFMKTNRDFTRTAFKAIRMEELSRPAVELIFGLALTFIIFYAGRDVIKGKMTVGEVNAFFLAFGMIIGPLRKLSDLNISLNQSVAAVESVFQILNAKPDVLDATNAKVLPGFQKEIRFEKVTFRYAKDLTPILSDFSLTIKKGEIVALVGASGAGKSTLLSLIPRFYDPESGSIKIDGMDLREVTQESLRAQVALVTQEVFLFHDSVKNNLRGGNHGISEDRLQKAAEAAQAWNYIRQLPEGWNTLIGDRGQKLSGGERQRLSIARAILKDAPILLLDEATSALDSENEKLVQEALDRLMSGRTAIVVAHRLSTIRKADRILVMEKGKILEEGTHEELWKKGGAYSKALAAQYGIEGRE
jgi:subfamily B ATP-binding cassette protein MsbA